MKEAHHWLRYLPCAAICLSISPALRAAEAPEPSAPVRLTRTARPWCAKLVCQRRGVTADLAGTPERAQGASPASLASLRVGAGFGAFYGPTEEVELVATTESFGTPWNSVRLGPPTLERRHPQVSGATLSLGVSLEQGLTSTSSLHWGLQERLSFTALLPLAGGSLVGGFADALVVAREPRWPVYLALGPSLGVAILDVHDELFYVDDPAVFVGAAAVAGIDLGDALPGTLELVGHLGKSLTYDDLSHRDLQLAFALPL